MRPPKRRLVLHPFLFTLYAVIALFVSNISEIRLAGLRALLFSVVGALFLVIFVRLVLKDKIKAGLISSGIILLVFSYGHVKTLTADWSIGEFQIGQPVVLVSIWISLFTLWAYLVLRKLKNIGVISDYLNWVSLDRRI